MVYLREDKDLKSDDKLGGRFKLETKKDFADYIDDLVNDLNDVINILSFDYKLDIKSDLDWQVKITVEPNISVVEKKWLRINLDDRFYTDLFEILLDEFGKIYQGKLDISKVDENNIIIKPIKQ